MCCVAWARGGEIIKRGGREEEAGDGDGDAADAEGGSVGRAARGFGRCARGFVGESVVCACRSTRVWDLGCSGGRAWGDVPGLAWICHFPVATSCARLQCLGSDPPTWLSTTPKNWWLLADENGGSETCRDLQWVRAYIREGEAPRISAWDRASLWVLRVSDPRPSDFTLSQRRLISVHAYDIFSCSNSVTFYQFHVNRVNRGSTIFFN